VTPTDIARAAAARLDAALDADPLDILSLRSEVRAVWMMLSPRTTTPDVRDECTIQPRHDRWIGKYER
jgi:hypothetical protein